MLSVQALSTRYARAHDLMRNLDGLQPQEAFEELLKYLFVVQNAQLGEPQPLGKPKPPVPSLFTPEKFSEKSIRASFPALLASTDDWHTTLWPERKIRLSASALTAIHGLFEDVDFNQVPFDIRAAALRTFLTPDIRRGLGIYLTPDDVARMMVDVLKPAPGLRVYDPACGSATFLIEVLAAWSQKSGKQKMLEVWGSDVNPRMLFLAELNLGHQNGVTFHRQILDALAPPSPRRSRGWPEHATFDLVITNPPFGVTLEGGYTPLHDFTTCRRKDGQTVRKQASEVVFIEQCLRLLKPNGTLAIVLPRSVLSNSGLADARAAIDKMAVLERIIMLPPETFAAAGTQTTTAVLFMRRLGERRPSKKVVSVDVVNVTNVGHDSTGRARVGNQLRLVSDALDKQKNAGLDIEVRRVADVPITATLSQIGRLITGSQPESQGSTPLHELVDVIGTGRTPARSAYAESGVFVVKVGNLSGRGIDWTPRDRNFITDLEGSKRLKNPALILRPGDILLTSSAHTPRYIAKKVDIVGDLPDFVGPTVSFVGEVMLIRCGGKGLDPYVLLAFLRLPSTMEALQRLVRGQTAHLMPADVRSLLVPKSVIEPSQSMRRIADMLREETRIARALSDLGHAVDRSLEEVEAAR